MFEQLIVLAAIALATGFIGWRVFKLFQISSGKSSCNACGTCPTDEVNSQKN